MTTDRLPPGAAALLARIERGELTEGDRLTLSRAVLAAVDGRPAAEILNSNARERRNDALRAMHSRHFADLAPSTAAKRIAETLRRYTLGSWPGDRVAEAPPRAGTLRRASYDVLRAGPAPAWRTVYAVLQRTPLSVASGLSAKSSPP